MSFGLRCKNADGDVQLDSNHRHVSISNTGNLVYASGGVATVDYTDVDVPPIVALQSNGNNDLVYMNPRYHKINPISGKAEAVVDPFVGAGTCSYPYTSSLEKANEAEPSGAVGLNVYDELGKVLFSSKEKYMKLIDIHPLPANVFDVLPYTLTVHDADNNYFFLTHHPVFKDAEPFIFDSWFIFYYSLNFLRTAPTSISVNIALDYLYSIYAPPDPTPSDLKWVPSNTSLVEVTF